MSQILTQPEEIDEVLKDFDETETKVDAPVAGRGFISRMRERAEMVSLNGASISAYRAAYMRSQNVGS